MNDSDSIEYSVMAAKLLTNFGFVEFLSIQWLMTLKEPKMKLKNIYSMRLHDRINEILSLVNKSDKFTKTEKYEILKIWKELNGKGREIRNSIAHSPFVQSRTSNTDGTQSINFEGFLTFNKKTNMEELISLEELKKAVDITANLIKKLTPISSTLQKTNHKNT
jgi:hypothetical protein